MLCAIVRVLPVQGRARFKVVALWGLPCVGCTACNAVALTDDHLEARLGTEGSAGESPNACTDDDDVCSACTALYRCTRALSGDVNGCSWAHAAGGSVTPSGAKELRGARRRLNDCAMPPHQTANTTAMVMMCWLCGFPPPNTGAFVAAWDLVLSQTHSTHHRQYSGAHHTPASTPVQTVHNTSHHQHQRLAAAPCLDGHCNEHRTDCGRCCRGTSGSPAGARTQGAMQTESTPPRVYRIPNSSSCIDQLTSRAWTSLPCRQRSCR